MLQTKDRDFQNALKKKKSKTQIYAAYKELTKVLRSKLTLDL